MGSLWSNRINPNLKNQSSLLEFTQLREVNRKNFKFVAKLSISGIDEETVIWLAENWDNSNEQFKVKKTDKNKVYQHHRVQTAIDELRLLGDLENNSFVSRPLFAFQDYASLYLVTEFVEGFSLETVLREHIFTEEEAKYVVFGLLSIIEGLHQHRYAVTQLNPKSIWVGKKNGKIKLIQLINPLPIDLFYPSNVITAISEYSAPEILTMDRVLAESDYYSLGLILYYIMKNKPAISIEHETQMTDQMSILNETIQVVKSDLPEGWKPEAIDFLVKLLIRNPELRLGRYGAFEIWNHPWLQNYTWTQSYTSININLDESHFKRTHYNNNLKGQNLPAQKAEINYSYDFQRLFKEYQYAHCEQDKQSISYESIQEEF